MLGVFHRRAFGDLELERATPAASTSQAPARRRRSGRRSTGACRDVNAHDKVAGRARYLSPAGELRTRFFEDPDRYRLYQARFFSDRDELYSAE